jgi:hypothetical protein
MENAPSQEQSEPEAPKKKLIAKSKLVDQIVSDLVKKYTFLRVIDKSTLNKTDLTLYIKKKPIFNVNAPLAQKVLVEFTNDDIMMICKQKMDDLKRQDFALPYLLGDISKGVGELLPYLVDRIPRWQIVPISTVDELASDELSMYVVNTARIKVLDFERFEALGRPWEMVARRMENFEAFAIRVYTMFCKPKFSTAQCIYMWGEGGDGKSTIIEVINDAINPKERDLYVQVDFHGLLNNPFATSALENKRFFVFEETTPKMLEHSAFKKLANDTLDISPKYQAQRTVKNHGTIFCLANDRPVLPDEEAVQRRVITCELKKIPLEELSPRAKGLLLETFDRLLSYGKGLYDKMPSGVNRIPEDGTQKLINKDEYDFDIRNFAEKSLSITGSSDDITARYQMQNAAIQYDMALKANMKYSKFMERLMKRYPKITKDKTHFIGVKLR